MLDLYKLEIFECVVEEGSFSAAAERLMMSQSGVSQHIRDLERTLGTQLFDRGRRGAKRRPPDNAVWPFTAHSRPGI